MRLRAFPVLLILALAATAGQAQYVEDSIDVGGAWVTGLAYNSQADVVYGVSQSSHYLFTIDCNSGTVRNRLYRDIPWNVVYDSIDNKAYLAQRSGVDSIIVVDGSTHQRIKGIPMYWAGGMVWNAANDRLYVAGGDENVVRVIDCATDSVIAVIPVSGCPTAVRLNTRHPKLYVLNWDSENVAIVNTESNTVIRYVPVGGPPSAACYSGAADKFYCGGTGYIVIYDGSGDTLLGGVGLPVGAAAMSLLAVDGWSVVVAGLLATGAPDSVYFIAASIDSVARAYAVGGEPKNLAYSAASGLVYSSNARTVGTVTAFRGDGSSMVVTDTVGDYPGVMLPVASHRRLYVGHSSTRYVYVIRDTVTGITEGREAVGAEQRQGCATVGRMLEWRGEAPAVVVDASGRKVATVVPGRNDVGRLPAGVYSVVGARGVTSRFVKVR